MLERLTATAAHRTGRMLVLPLHSSVSPQEQRRIFDRPPPGARKVGALGRAGGAPMPAGAFARCGVMRGARTAAPDQMHLSSGVLTQSRQHPPVHGNIPGQGTA